MKGNIIFETGYFQASNDIFDSDMELKSNEKLVYLYLVRCGNNSKAFPSYNTIGKKCSISRSTAIRCVKTLTEKGLIKKEYRISEFDDRNLTNIYRIVPPSVTKTPPSTTVTPNKELSNKKLRINKGTKQDLALSFSEYMKLQQLNNDTINVVNYYLDRYKHVKGKEHPRLKEKQWEHVVSNLFYVVDYNNSVDFDLSEDDLILMIEKHFITTYQDGCDYNILHFMSDGVRVNRMYEVAY